MATDAANEKLGWQIITGDALEVLEGMDGESVDCMVTSPPFYALRDYGVEGQLGLEEHPQLYLEKLWAIFDEVKRVLKPTGTCWVNLGDTFGGSHCGANDYRDEDASISKSDAKYQGQGSAGASDGSEWLKPKNLLMMPERFAIGMSDRGWWLRNKVIWSKTNPMPESVKSRFSTTWEYIFYFSPEQDCWFDLDAVREEPNWGHPAGNKHKKREHPMMSDNPANNCFHPRGKNPGDCWSIPTKAFPEAHFATFPPRLIIKPIRAGCPPKVCVECGKPWERITEVVEKGSARDTSEYAANLGGKSAATRTRGNIIADKRKTLGWQPTCECDGETEPGIVCDPFAGAHTTGVVAIREGRRYIGVDISAEYNEMGRKRLLNTQPSLL